MAFTAARRLAPALLLALALLPASARAAGFSPYDPAAFRAAQEAGKPILVWVHAEW